MFGLRQKLAFGFGGLLLILLGVSGLGIAVLRQHRSALDQFLYENWRSVEYGQNMVGALEQLDDLARSVAGTGGLEGSGFAQIDAIRTSSANLLEMFDKNLNDESHNITLEGEDQLVKTLTEMWTGPTGYRKAFSTAIDPKVSLQERASAYAGLHDKSRKVKANAQAIVKLNLANMKPIDGRAKAMSDAASRLMLILAAVGVAVAILVIAVMGRSILKPIETLTHSAREIEQGNLDLVVQVKSRDELHQLAEAFNSMAAKLREYRRTNRAKLVRTQQTTQLAINSLPDVVAILSPDGMIEMANSAAQRLFGLRADAHVSEIRVEWLADLYRRTSQTLMPIEPRGYESAVQVLNEGGGERFFLPHAVPILDDGHELLGVTVVLADVTNLRRLDEMKSGMLAVVSHELKTPLTSIRMGVHLLLEERIGSLNAKQNELLTAVRDDSDRLNQIISILLDMGRIESGRALMDLKSEAAEKMVAESTQSLRSAFSDRGVELSIEIPSDTPAVLVDASRIGHVFSNLLTNALKYTAPGGQVRVTASTENSIVRFSISDAGNGIPQSHLPHVFERFFRVPGQSGETGAGLGLAIAKEIVKAHGGQIAVESRENVGTTFSFTLRIANAEAERIQHAYSNIQDGSSQELVHENGTHTDR